MLEEVIMDKGKKTKADKITIENVSITGVERQGIGFGNCLDVHADELFKKVKRNPLLSMIVASSVGYIIAKLTK